jgi:hypothetical protein
MLLLLTICATLCHNDYPEHASSGHCSVLRRFYTYAVNRLLAGMTSHCTRLVAQRLPQHPAKLYGGAVVDHIHVLLVLLDKRGSCNRVSAGVLRTAYRAARGQEVAQSVLSAAAAAVRPAALWKLPREIRFMRHVPSYASVRGAFLRSPSAACNQCRARHGASLNAAVCHLCA